MIRTLCVLLYSLFLVGCAVLGAEDKKTTLADLPHQPITLLNDQLIAIDHQQVMQRYQHYLQVEQHDNDMRIRVAHRIADLKLQQQELALLDNLDLPETEQHSADFAVIDDYEQLLSRYPQRADNDAVLYQLAKAYSLAGQQHNSINALQRLTQQHPNSSLYLEGLFRLAQLYYATYQFEQAGNVYQSLLEQGREGNDYYLSAAYLYGWSLFQQSRFSESLLAFTRVLDEEFSHPQAFEQQGIENQDIRDDSLRIMAIIFTELGGWEQIAEFYHTHGQRFYEYKLYERLASLYYQRNHYRSAASTLRAFVDRYPLDKRALAYYQRLIDGYKEARYANLTRQHQQEFIQRFDVQGDYWQQHPQLQPQLAELLSQYLWELAGFYHAWGQQTRNPAEKQQRLELAASWYEHYVNRFPQADDAVNAHFLLAEVAFELRDFVRAKEHYEIVAYQYPHFEQASEAGYAAILAYNQHRPESTQALAWRQATVASASRFVQEFASDSRSGTVLVNTAEMLLNDGYYLQALHSARLAARIEQSLAPRYRYGAALVRSHAAFELGYYAEAETAITLALAQQQADQNTHRDLRTKLAASIYRQGEQSNAQQDKQQAVYHWLRLGSVVPESDTKILAEYDAATLLMEMADYPQAVQVLQQFRQRYPQHRLVADIPSKLIVAYEQQQQWQEAAFELERLCQHNNNAEEQRIACFQAAQYFAQAEDFTNARDSYRNYAHQYPQPFTVALEAHYQLDQIYARLGDEERRRFWLDKIISLHQQAGAEQSDRSRYLAASAAFELAEFERAKFERSAITLPLNRSIVVKSQYLQQAQQRYTQAAQLGVLEFTTASTYHLGELYAQMSYELNHSPRPAGLDELELEEYEFLIEEQTYPLDDAAIEIHQTNIGRARDQLFDSWISKSFASLAKLMPGQYNKPERVMSYVEQIR